MGCLLDEARKPRAAAGRWTVMPATDSHDRSVPSIRLTTVPVINLILRLSQDPEDIPAQRGLNKRNQPNGHRHNTNGQALLRVSLATYTGRPRSLNCP